MKVLTYIDKNSGTVTMWDISERTGIPRKTTDRIVAGLIESGCAEIGWDGVALAITEEGKKEIRWDNVL